MLFMCLPWKIIIHIHLFIIVADLRKFTLFVTAENYQKADFYGPFKAFSNIENEKYLEKTLSFCNISLVSSRKLLKQIFIFII